MAQSGYGMPNPGRDYFYLKASVSEPFNWVYGALAMTAMTAMTNLNDGSYQITPEITYTGFSNVELRARAIFFGGKSQRPSLPKRPPVVAWRCMHGSIFEWYLPIPVPLLIDEREIHHA